MGQNSKIRESSYSKITTQLSTKEESGLQYDAISKNEIETNKKHERTLFLYQLIFIVILLALAFIKEKFFPSHISWIDWMMQKF